MEKMTAWEDCRVWMLELLGDTAGKRYQEGMLRVGMQFALEVYSLFYPRTNDLTLSAANLNGSSAQAALSPEPGIILNSVYLWDDALPGWQEICCVVESWESQLVLRSESFRGKTLPLEIRLKLQLPHEIAGLNNALSGSVPECHLAMLCGGAAGFAARTRAAAIAEVSGKKPEDFSYLTRLSKDLLGRYQQQLENDAAAGRLAAALPYPATGFRI